MPYKLAQLALTSIYKECTAASDILISPKQFKERHFNVFHGVFERWATPYSVTLFCPALLDYYQDLFLQFEEGRLAKDICSLGLRWKKGCYRKVLIFSDGPIDLLKN
jgi:hypothetical protein